MIRFSNWMLITRQALDGGFAHPVAFPITTCGLMCLFWTAMVPTVVLGNPSPPLRTDVVTITLHSDHYAVANRQISIDSIAKLSGGAVRQRSRMAALDLDVIQESQPVEITHQQIEIRLLLAGFSPNEFRLTGPTRTRVRLGKPEVLLTQIESKLGQELARQFGIKPNDVQITLLNQPAIEQIRAGIDTSDFRVTSVFPNRLPLGEKKITTEFRDNHGNRIGLTLSLRIVVMRDVYMTSSLVPRGSVITASHIQAVRRPLADSAIQPAGAECLGCTAVRDIPAHEVVSKRLISRRKPRRQILIKRNDLVDIIFKRGSLNVRLKNAKALSSGGEGEVIELLNTASDKRVRGTIVDASTVVVNQ